MTFNQSQAKFTYSPPGQASKRLTNKKRLKIKEKSRDLASLNPKKQSKSLNGLFQKNLLNTDAKDEKDKIKTIEQEIIGDNLIHKKGNKKDKTLTFQKFKTKRFLMVLHDAFEEEINLQDKIGKVIYSTNPKIQNKEEEKALTTKDYH